MANMAYCRFSNTLVDLRDCYAHLADVDLSADESEARRMLLALCERMGDEGSRRIVVQAERAQSMAAAAKRAAK